MPAWAHTDENRVSAWSLDVCKDGDLTDRIDLSKQTRFLCGRGDGSKCVDIDLGDGASERDPPATVTANLLVN